MRMGLTVAFAALALLAGCATTSQGPLPLDQRAVGVESGKVAVAMTPLPKVDTHLFGADCLLCLAVASAANSSLTSHAKTLPYEDLPQLKEQLAALLRKKGTDVVVVGEPLDIGALPSRSGSEPNLAPKDFTSLQAKYKADRLLVVDVSTLGFRRNYASYVPTTDPKATMRATGYIVNLKSNTYEWYRSVDITRSADKAWDEPPKFPGLTNAYFQVLEMGKDELLDPFAK